MEYFINLIHIILFDFYKFPNYSHFINIYFIYKFLINQIKNSMCKIIRNEKKYFGLFCNITLDNSENKLRVLITTTNAIGSKQIAEKKDIKLDKKEEIYIKVNDEKKIYCNEKEGISIIELTKDDNMKDITF